MIHLYLRALLPILLLAGGPFLLQAQETLTLRNWIEIPSGQYQAFRFPTQAIQVERFDLPAPGTITAVRIGLAGPASEVQFFIYGHEGGVMFPQLMAPLRSYTFQKPEGGGIFPIELPEPVFVDNDQIFIGVTGLAEGTLLLTDTTRRQPTCASSSGGNYYYQFQNPGPNWRETRWQVAAFSYLIEVDLEVETTQPGNLMVDVTEAAGLPLDANAQNMAWADYNHDTLPDVLLRGRLFANQGDGTFVEETAAAGLSGNPHTSVFIDMDNDRDLDILFLRLGPEQENRLWINDGNGRFTGRTLTGLDTLPGISSVSIADVNHDHLPDLFVGQLWSTYPDSLPNFLYINNGDYDFRDETRERLEGYGPHRRSRGSSFVDYDNDGDLDLFVGNYFLEPDELWQNDGRGYFTDVAASRGIDRYEYINAPGRFGSSHATGCDWADYDRDGDMDLLLPGLAHPGFMIQYNHRPTVLYDNNGAAGDFSFTERYDPETITTETGIQYEETHTGATWGDVNSDGRMDFFINTFYGCRYVELYTQNAQGSFDLATFDYGLQRIVNGDDAVWVDYDNDGRLDLAAGENRRFRLFRNTSTRAGNYVLISLRSPDGLYYPIGARVEVYAGGERYIQEVVSGRGIRMQKPLQLHFGLGDAEAIDSVQVHWPGDSVVTDVYYDLPVNASHVLEQRNYPVSTESRLISTKLRVSVFPNPARDAVRFRVAGGVLQRVELLTMTGEQVLRVLNNRAGTNSLTVPLEDAGGKQLPAGVYAYRVQTDRGTQWGRLFIE